MAVNCWTLHWPCDIPANWARSTIGSNSNDCTSPGNNCKRSAKSKWRGCVCRPFFIAASKIIVPSWRNCGRTCSGRSSAATAATARWWHVNRMHGAWASGSRWCAVNSYWSKWVEWCDWGDCLNRVWRNRLPVCCLTAMHPRGNRSSKFTFFFTK